MSKNAVFTVEEQYDMEAVRALLRTLPPDHHDVNKLKYINENANKGKLIVVYTRKEGSDCGRCSSNGVWAIST